MIARLALPAVLLLTAALPAEPQPLSEALRPDFYSTAPWSPDEAEVSRYDLTIPHDGRELAVEAVIVLRRETYTREFHVPASWPHGQKPLFEGLRCTINYQIPLTTDSRRMQSQVVFPVGESPRAVRATMTVVDWEGTTLLDFRRWQEPFTAFHLSPRDGDGTGEWRLEGGFDARFEEELPATLRALRFEEQLEARFTLYPGQLHAGTTEPKPSESVLRVRRDGDDWLVDLESADGRMQEFRYAAEPPHVLKGWRHSDGREFRLRDRQLQAYWLAQP